MRSSTIFATWAIIMCMPFSAVHAQPPSPPSEIKSISVQEFRALLDQARGDIVLINLWATWCAPCLREIPELLRLQEEYQGKGFRLIAVAMDDPGDLESHVIPFRNQRFPDWETFHAAELESDRFVSVVDPGWNEILPTSYLIDRTGNVATVLFGGQSYEDFETALLKIL